MLCLRVCGRTQRGKPAHLPPGGSCFQSCKLMFLTACRTFSHTWLSFTKTRLMVWNYYSSRKTQNHCLFSNTPDIQPPKPGASSCPTPSSHPPFLLPEPPAGQRPPAQTQTVASLLFFVPPHSDPSKHFGAISTLKHCFGSVTSVSSIGHPITAQVVMEGSARTAGIPALVPPTWSALSLTSAQAAPSAACSGLPA